LPVVHGLPFYVAMEKGYFAAEGIEIERVAFEAPNLLIDAILNGTVDISSPTAALSIAGIANHKNPNKLKVYMVNGGKKGNSGENLITYKESNLQKIEDLKGKKLGILAGTIQWRTIVREILAQHGLNMDTDLTIVELAGPVQVQALASKQIDALFALEPIPTIALTKGIARVLFQSPAAQFIAEPFWGGVGVINHEFAQKNPNTTKNFLRAIEKATADIKSDPKGNTQYLKGHTALTDEIINAITIIDFKMGTDLTATDKESIEKFFAIFTKHKVTDSQIDFNSMVYQE